MFPAETYTDRPTQYPIVDKLNKETHTPISQSITVKKQNNLAISRAAKNKPTADRECR